MSWEGFREWGKRKSRLCRLFVWYTLGMNIESKLIILCGMPGVGKTTYAKKLESENKFKRLSLDEMVSEKYSGQKCDLGIKEYAAKYEAIQDIISVIKDGESVILDYGFFKQKERDFYRSLAKDYGIKSEVHFVKTDYDTQLSRVLARNAEEDNIHHIDKEILDFLITLFEVPSDEDVVVIET